MNEKRIATILKLMHCEAMKYNPPIFRVENKIKGDPFKILVFTMLSARTRDEVTLDIVEKLFGIAKSPREIHKLGKSKLEKIIFGIGFYRNKTKNLIELSKSIEKRGSVPDTLEELLLLPGVGRKTANIVLAKAFGKNTLGVDIHVHRISNRLGLVKTTKPVDTEDALVKIIPKKYIRSINSNFVAFGQSVCHPRNPSCHKCPLNKICPSSTIQKH
ncbi:MAG: endonuclease III [Candidatus Micrarchaeota archaeon]|nr:endonuclease III [Candidatus Micrarchaeota archaeon]